MNERNWRQRDAVDAQEHKDDEKMIETADILSQDKEQQKNTEEERFLNQRDIIKCMSARNQFWSSDTWD